MWYYTCCRLIVDWLHIVLLVPRQFWYVLKRKQLNKYLEKSFFLEFTLHLKVIQVKVNLVLCNNWNVKNETKSVIGEFCLQEVLESYSCEYFQALFKGHES